MVFSYVKRNFRLVDSHCRHKRGSGPWLRYQASSFEWNSLSRRIAISFRNPQASVPRCLPYQKCSPSQSLLASAYSSSSCTNTSSIRSSYHPYQRSPAHISHPPSLLYGFYTKDALARKTERSTQPINSTDLLSN